MENAKDAEEDAEGAEGGGGGEVGFSVLQLVVASCQLPVSALDGGGERRMRRKGGFH